MAVFVRSADVAHEISTRLSTIRTANGYETEIGSNVFRGKRKLPADDEVPLCILIEGDDRVDDDAGRQRTALIKVTQTYVIDGFSTCDPDNPNDAAHAMIRDIKKVLFKDGRTFGGKVSEVVYQGRDIGPRTDGVAIVQARVVVTVSFAEDLANP